MLPLFNVHLLFSCLLKNFPLSTSYTKTLKILSQIVLSLLFPKEKHKI
ncbi:hypothetical protein BSM4216_3719 [Bacillus smithii]|nr:hypothetical protein BSM4216_3719 [Bacillus smithii]